MKNKKKNFGDEFYVLKAQQGDQDALVLLLERYHKLAHYIALKICHNDADAEDIVQESFIEVQRSISNLHEPKFFKAWLNKIIFSKCTKLFRANKDVVMSDEDMNYLNHNIEQRVYMLPERSMKFNSDKELLMVCIEQLPEKMQMMIIMMYFEQMSLKEIALACDVPLGTVKSRLNYAKKELRIMIEDYEQSEGVKVDFHSTTLEAMLLAVFANEARSILPALAIGKGFHFHFKGHVIEPTMLLAATLGTCATVAGASIVVPYIQETFLSSPETNLVHEQMKTTTKPFPIITFKGELIKNEEKAFKALNDIAHCHVEIAELSAQEQAEVYALYEALQQHGGAYYELLKNRNYME